MLMKKAVATVVMTGALSMVGTAAFAHECFVVNRSATSTEKVTRSGQWATVTVDEELFASAPVPLTDWQIQYALAHYVAAGGQTTLAIFEGGRTIPAGRGFAGGADGSGIDHLFHEDGLLLQAFMAALDAEEPQE